MANKLLFQNNKNYDSITIIDFGYSITSGTSQVGVPKFQRDAVWDERRYEILWDSILRGFPIGAFIVAKANDKKAFKNYSTSKADQMDKYDKYQVLPVRVIYRTPGLVTFPPKTDPHVKLER
jgi:uncharacterized protein with ParB-like and HNH nuclease domain